MDFDIIVVGSYSVDLIFSGMAEFPQLGKDTLSTSFKVTPGEAFIAATCMHRLGIKVGWATDFGNDEYSQLALQASRQEGLDESLFIMHQNSYRRVSVVATFPQDRGFLTYYDPDPKIPAALPAIINSQAKLVYFPGLYYGPLLNSGVKLIRQKKMHVVMDGNSSSGDIYGKSNVSKSIRKAITACDFFLPNADEARRLTGKYNLEDALKELSSLCPRVIIKDGRHGSIALENNKLVSVAPIRVNAVDTTGAGDNYNAGFLRAWLDGQDLETCMAWGNVCGGLSTTEPGGTTCQITLDRVRRMVRSMPR